MLTRGRISEVDLGMEIPKGKFLKGNSSREHLMKYILLFIYKDKKS